jgi:hypothetical protein
VVALGNIAGSDLNYELGHAVFVMRNCGFAERRERRIGIEAGQTELDCDRKWPLALDGYEHIAIYLIVID